MFKAPVTTYVDSTVGRPLAIVDDVPVASTWQKRFALTVFVAFTPAACDRPSEAACRVGQVTSAIVGGYSRTEYLGISEAERDALVALQLERQSTGPDLCSGV